MKLSAMKRALVKIDAVFPKMTLMFLFLASTRTFSKVQYAVFIRKKQSCKPKITDHVHYVNEYLFPQFKVSKGNSSA